ncbi:hypothetical protein GIB67_031434 [Kingdonia uniflora]|uniref:Protein FAR1-RELATED SEQUENCE n=1 Tax=Kingdonia uniflora TaxID=39325 RepID=A0A7J7MBA7_9MAGN|nr:hypothetical protein GIB67_031434 [Kingdonia uniflora]
MKKYNLDDNNWMQGIFNIRERWIPWWNRGTFYVGISTTGRSESTNNFFNGWLLPTTGLYSFVTKYATALLDTFEREKEEDFQSQHKYRQVRPHQALLKYSLKIYTRQIFHKVKDQFNQVVRFVAIEKSINNNVREILVKLHSGLPESFELKIDLASLTGNCEWKLFEYVGQNSACSSKMRHEPEMRNKPLQLPPLSQQYEKHYGHFQIKVAKLCERFFRQLPYDVVLPEWPLNLVGLDDEGRRVEQDRFVWCNIFRRSLLDPWVRELTVQQLACDKIMEEDVRTANGEIILCGELNHWGCFRCNWDARMRSKPSIHASKFVVSSDSEETSSSGRVDKCSVMEETVNSVGTTIEVCCPAQLNGNVYEMMRVCEELNEKYEKEGIVKQFIAEDVLKFYKWKYMEGRNSGYLYSNSARPKFFDFKFVEQEIIKPAAGGVEEKPKVSVSALGKAEKSSLKRKWHLEEDSHRTNPHVAAKMKELEQKYCYMAGTNSQQLEDEYLKHTFARSQEFNALTAKFEAQSARVKELEADLLLGRERRAADATAAIEKFSDLLKHDKLMTDAVAAALVERYHFVKSYYSFGLSVDDVKFTWNGRYADIEFPAKVEEEEMAGETAGLRKRQTFLQALQSQSILLSKQWTLWWNVLK